MERIILNKLYIILLASFLGLFLLFSGCVSETETIKIGALYPLSGGTAYYGEMALKSAQIAVNEINSNGGINDQNLELVVEDHQCTPKIGLTAFEQMSDIKNIKLFSTMACTGVSLAIAPELKDKNSVMVATLVTASKATNISPNFFRNWANNSQESKLFADEIIKLNINKVGIIYEETDYAKGLKIDLETYLKDTTVQIVSEGFTSDAVDLKSQITKLMSENVDLVFISPQAITTGTVILKQMQDSNFNPKLIFVNDVVLKSNLIVDYNVLLNNAYSAEFVFGSNDKQEKLYVKYKELYGVDCPQKNICSGIYDSIYMYADAIEKVGNDSSKIRDYIASNVYEGITGNISFDSKNDRANAEYSLFLIKDGKVELVN
jgi:branched-chain amino acid transport system substrate-binding protein